jgi:hypothetical protein
LGGEIVVPRPSASASLTGRRQKCWALRWIVVNCWVEGLTEKFRKPLYVTPLKWVIWHLSSLRKKPSVGVDTFTDYRIEAGWIDEAWRRERKQGWIQSGYKMPITDRTDRTDRTWKEPTETFFPSCFRVFLTSKWESRIVKDTEPTPKTHKTKKKKEGFGWFFQVLLVLSFLSVRCLL